MNAPDNTHPTTSTDDDGWLDPREAADLLQRTQRDAQRKLTSDTPLLSLFSALVVLAVYGSIWSSSRGHHPYRGPSLDVVGYVYILVAVSGLVSTAVWARRTAGVSGRSRRDAGTLAIPFVVAVVGVYVFDIALRVDGFSDGIVYGVFDAAAPWLVVGAVLAGYSAAKEDWWKVAGGVSMMIVAAGAAFAGPVGVWGILAVGGFVLLIAQGALRLRVGRQSAFGPATAVPSGAR